MKKKRRKSSAEALKRATALATLIGDTDAENALGALTDADTSPIDNDRIDDSLETVIEREGDAKQAARLLVVQNLKLRRRARMAEAILQADVEEMPEGSIVLTPDEAKLWAAIKDLKLDPATIATDIQELSTLRTKGALDSRKELVEAAADAMGWNGALLAHILPATVTLELVTLKKGEEPTPFIVETVNGQQVKSTLEDYATKNFAPFLDSLEVLPNEDENEADDDSEESETVNKRKARQASASKDGNGNGGVAWVQQPKSEKATGSKKKLDPYEAAFATHETKKTAGFKSKT